MEITALRAQLADLEEENLNLEIQIRKEVQEEYRELVQALFMTCLHIKVSVLAVPWKALERLHGCLPTEGPMAEWTLRCQVILEPQVVSWKVLFGWWFCFVKSWSC